MQPRQIQRVAIRGVGPDEQPVSARWLRHGQRPVDALGPAGPHPATLRGVHSRVVGLDPLGLLVHELVVELESGPDPAHLPSSGPDLYGNPPPDDLVDHLEDAGQAPGEPEVALRVQRTGAYALILDGRRLLLTRLGHSQEWTLPGGGVDFGEHPEATVRREVLEETGLTLGDVRLLDVDTDHWTGRAPYGRLEDFHAVRILYAATFLAGTEPAVMEVGGSTDAVAWVPVQALAGMSLGSTVRLALRHLPDLPDLPDLPALQRFR